MLGVLVQRPGRHALRAHDERFEQLGVDAGAPLRLVVARGARAVGRKLRLDHLGHGPHALAGVVRHLRRGELAQAVVRVEIVDQHALQVIGLLRGAHVDECALVLEPQAGAQVLADQHVQRPQPDSLPRLLGRGREPLARHERHDDEREADLGQRQRGARRGQARNAHHRILRIAGEVREHVHGADQHHHREQLVGVRRHQQGHHREHLLELVVAPAEIAQLADQVEKREQREKAHQHEADRGEDLAREVALEGAQLAHRALAPSGRAAAGTAACAGRTSPPAGPPCRRAPATSRC